MKDTDIYRGADGVWTMLPASRLVHDRVTIRSADGRVLVGIKDRNRKTAAVFLSLDELRAMVIEAERIIT